MNHLSIFEDITEIMAKDFAGAEQRIYPDAQQPFLAFCSQLDAQYNFEDEQLFNFIQLYLQTIGSPKVTFSIRPHHGYQPYTRGFSVRSDGSDLFVSAVNGETRVQPGERILKLNYASPASFHSIASLLQHEVSISERDRWDAYLNHAKVMLVEHTDGTQEKIILQKFPLCAAPAAQFSGQTLTDGAFYLRIDHFNDANVITHLIETYQETFALARHLVLDLRQNDGGIYEAFLPLLPYLCDHELSLNEFIPDNAVYTRYTSRNCDLSLKQLRPYCESPDAAIRAAAETFCAEIEAHRDQGWTLQEDPLSEEKIPCQRVAETITLLTDSSCEDEAERFALACRRFSGVRLVGRPTRGSLEYSNPVSVDYGYGRTFTYPISRSVACQAGQGYAQHGVPVDIYIPWSPAEINEDRILTQALTR
jgi:hypothetical protein